MRYASRRSALRGIVQSLLITRHMLFAGFSLNDDNFHRYRCISPYVSDAWRYSIADEVRQALGSQDKDAGKKFGSALNLIHNPLLELLWGKDLSLVRLKRLG